jgi:hypothetical protein
LRFRRLQSELQKLRNKQKEEDAKEELRRLIVLGSLGEGNTSKLPRTNKLNFEVKTVVDPTGYGNVYNYENPKREFKHKSRYDFK